MFKKQKSFISLHDCDITDIIINKNEIRFVFESFDLIENGRISVTDGGTITLKDCESIEFSCYIINRKITKKGTKLYGRPLSLYELKNYLQKKHCYIEIIEELYDYGTMFWLGELCPKKPKNSVFRKLFPYVVIESAFCPMDYTWNSAADNDG